MFLCITIFFQDKFAKVIGCLTWLRFCETCADLEWQPVWRSGYLILPLLHCTTNITTIASNAFIGVSQTPPSSSPFAPLHY